MGIGTNISTAAGYGGTVLSALNATSPGILAGTGLAAAPATLGISAIPLAVQIFSKIGAGRRAADDLVQNYQDAFLKQVMAPISQQAATDPAGAQAAFAKEWTAYLGEVNQFAAQSPNNAKVVNQMLNTPSFMNTAKALLPPSQNNPLDPSYVNGQGFQSQNSGPSLLGAAAPLIASAGIDGVSKLLGGNNSGSPSTSTVGTPESPWTPDGSTGTAASGGVGGPASTSDPNSIASILSKVLGGGAGGATSAAGGTSQQSLLQSLLPLILGGASVGSNIFTAANNNSAANNAAQIQADAATKAAQLQAQTAQNSLDQQQKQFDTTQANQQPWLSAGTTAINTLSQQMQDGTYSPYGQTFQGNPDGNLFTQDPNTAQQFTGNPNVNQQFTGNPNVNQQLTADPNTAQQFNANPNVLQAPQFNDKFSFTAADMLNDPGYQNRLDESNQALQRAASAKGNLFSPGTAAAIASKVGAQASDEFGTAYNRAQQDYLNKYNVFTGNAASTNAAAQGNYTNAANQTAQNNQSNQTNFGNLSGETAQNNQANQTNLGNALNINGQNNQANQSNLSNALGITQQNNTANQTNYGNASNQNTQNNATLNQNYQNELTKFMNGYNIYNQDQTNLFNRNAAISGIGQTAAGNVQSAGQNLVNQNGQTNQASTSNINDLMTQLANAQAQQKINSASNTSGAVNNTTSDIASILQQYLNKGNNSGSIAA